jgi:hypothetical protein
MAERGNPVMLLKLGQSSAKMTYGKQDKEVGKSECFAVM